ncbi:hypothetical protein M1512_03930, partial [Patescibacteria group bacterium]|nr:hypothetical protein [Patescibacteria group bacterium]
DNKPEEPKTVETAVVQPTGLDKRTGVHPQSTAIPPTGSEGSITWTASEFIAHNKGPLWYITLTAVSVVVAFLVWLWRTTDMD